MLKAALKAWKDLSMYTLPYLIIISLFKNQLFFFFVLFFCHSKYILGDVLDNYVQNFENISFAKKCISALECVYSILPFNFVIWQVACGYFYSLKHNSLDIF